MNFLKTALSTAALGFCAATAFAGTADAPLTKTVNYAALDVTKADGAEHLYQRLRAAAESVCAPADGGTLTQKYNYRVCVDTALSNAIVRVDQPLVKNIHDSRNKNIRLATL